MLYVSIYIHIYTHTCIHTYVRTYIRMRAYTHPHGHSNIHAPMRAQTHNMYINLYMHGCVCVCLCLSVCTCAVCVHVYAYVHAWMDGVAVASGGMFNCHPVGHFAPKRAEGWRRDWRTRPIRKHPRRVLREEVLPRLEVCLYLMLHKRLLGCGLGFGAVPKAAC